MSFVVNLLPRLGPVQDVPEKGERGPLRRRTPGNKSLLVLFFRKDHLPFHDVVNEALVKFVTLYSSTLVPSPSVKNVLPFTTLICGTDAP
jgi:hypothetical protein